MCVNVLYGASDPLEMQLLMLVSGDVGAGNWTQALCKKKYLKPLSYPLNNDMPDS